MFTYFDQSPSGCSSQDNHVIVLKSLFSGPPLIFVVRTKGCLQLYYPTATAKISAKSYSSCRKWQPESGDSLNLSCFPQNSITDEDRRAGRWPGTASDSCSLMLLPLWRHHTAFTPPSQPQTATLTSTFQIRKPVPRGISDLPKVTEFTHGSTGWFC